MRQAGIWSLPFPAAAYAFATYAPLSICHLNSHSGRFYVLCFHGAETEDGALWFLSLLEKHSAVYVCSAYVHFPVFGGPRLTSYVFLNHTTPLISSCLCVCVFRVHVHVHACLNMCTCLSVQMQVEAEAGVRSLCVLLFIEVGYLAA